MEQVSIFLICVLTKKPKNFPNFSTKCHPKKAPTKMAEMKAIKTNISIVFTLW
jgi:hypothetical protein